MKLHNSAFGLMVATALAILDTGFVRAQGANPTAVLERERPAIQALLERALAAERAEDSEALRALLTAGTLSSRDRANREYNLTGFRGAGFSELDKIEIVKLDVDAQARWARVRIVFKSRDFVYGRFDGHEFFDLRRENGAWKLDTEEEDRSYNCLFTQGRGKTETLIPAPTLAAQTLQPSDVPSGWLRTADASGLAGCGDARTSYVAESLGTLIVEPTPEFTTFQVSLDYLLLTDSELASWRFWRASLDAKPTSRFQLEDGSLIAFADNSVFLQKGRIFVSLSASQSMPATLLYFIAGRAAARLR